MRARARTRISIPGIVALLALVGCGATGTRPPPTKAQFAVQADAVCRFEAEKLSRAAAFERAPVAAFSTVPRLIRQAVAIRELADARLEALRVPAGEAATIGRWLTARTVAATLQRDAAEAPAGQYPKATRDLDEALSRARALEHRLSEGHGFTICGKTG
jgi:hypothetical protein